MSRVPAMTPEATFSNQNINAKFGKMAVAPFADKPVLIWLLMTSLYFEYAFRGFQQQADEMLRRRSLWAWERMTGDQQKEAGLLRLILEALDGSRRFG